jgi:cleavage stimulation factor subunit 3
VSSIVGQGAKEEEDAATVQSRAALPQDIFRLRQIQRSRGGLGATSVTQSGSSAFSFSGGGSAFSGGGSAFSGDQSASTD